jgi:hypothetical protein
MKSYSKMAIQSSLASDQFQRTHVNNYVHIIGAKSGILAAPQIYGMKG